MTPRTARAGLAALAAAAGVESGLAAVAYRDAISDEDWARLAAALAHDDADAVRLATGWLGPRARMEVPRLAAATAAAPPDLAGITSLTVVGLGDTAWSDALQRDLEGRPPPELRAQTELGPFLVSRYAFTGEPRTLVDWTQHPPALSTPSGACARRRGWTCTEGRAELAYAEIDYTPRRCFTSALEDGTPLRFSARQMELGTQVVGHVGVTDFNSRLRNDAPIQVQIKLNAETVSRFVVTDEEGWRPFSVTTTPGLAALEVIVTDTVQGIWGRDGHRTDSSRRVCFELRSLAPGAR